MAHTDFASCVATTSTRTATRFSLHAILGVWRSRRALARLDARALNDIGLSPRCAANEAAKPIWDVPANWRG